MNEPLHRRNFLSRLALVAASTLTFPFSGLTKSLKPETLQPSKTMNPIKSVKPMGFMWDTADPFLFCVHHEDYFPAGNEAMGPDPSYFKGRHMGDDFIIKDGFRMYHGKTVPGFPGHPHRGFETVTVVRKGLVDHSDSMGASGRYGNGDVQWMTAGKGVQHAEMFPLIHQNQENPMELFQIWLNLPKKHKMVEPYFKMFWRESIPNYMYSDNKGKNTVVEVIAGTLDTFKAPAPPPDSWAADPANEVAVWNIKMDAGATWVLPAASPGINRMLYIYEGNTLTLNEQVIDNYHALELEASMALNLTAGDKPLSMLMLQGKPIGETVIQYRPFVMNTKEEINQAFEDYHQTQFGGWPWPEYDHVHPREKTRFARHADGREEVQNS